MADIKEIIQDKDFLALPKPEQVKVLRKVDSDFNQLDDKQANIALEGMTFKGGDYPVEQPVVQFEKKPSMERGMGPLGVIPYRGNVVFRGKKYPFLNPAGGPEQYDPQDEQKNIYKRDLIKGGIIAGGDVAGTMLAPQLKLAQQAPRLARWGTKGANLVSRMMGSGGGSAGGSVVGDVATGQDINLDQAAIEGLMGAGGEFGMSGIGGIGKALMGKKTADAAVDIGRDAVKFAVPPSLKKTPLSLQAEYTGVIPKVLDMVTDFTMAGRVIKKDARAKLIKDTTKGAEEFAKTFGLKETTPETAGLMAGNAIKSQTDFDKFYKPYHDMIKEAADDEGGRLILDDTTQYLNNLKEGFLKTESSNVPFKAAQVNATDRVIEEFGFKPNSREGKVIKRFMMNDTADPQTVKYFFSNIWKRKFKTDPPYAVKAKEQLKKIMLGDLDRLGKDAAGQSIKDYKVAADEMYAKMHNILRQVPTVKKYMGKSFQAPGQQVYEYVPERFAKDMFEKNSAGQILKIEKDLLQTPQGKEAYAALKYNWLDDLYKQSTKTDEVGQTQFMPYKFYELVKDNAYKIQKIYPESYEKIFKQARFYNGIANEYRRAIKSANQGSIIEDVARSALAVGSMGVSEGFGAISAWSLMGPKTKALIGGLMKTGKPIAKTGLHVGGQPAFLGGDRGRN